MKYITYKLRQIAEFNLYDDIKTSPIRLPEIQRGLVWKSRQVELLWDSILSEYPIGSFMIVNNELYDGQQRVSAITSGFAYKALFDEEKIPESILWLDLGFQEDDSLSRRYGFRLTTKAHPWGYNIQDGNVFTTYERRSILKEVYGDEWENKKKEEWDIRNFTPYNSKVPIPFAILLEFIYKKDNFVNNVTLTYKHFIETYLKESIEWTKEFENKIRTACDKLYESIKKIKEYEVVAHCIEPSNTDKKYLELFFNRINTGGTRISQEELAYSAIKLYWEDNEYGKDLDNKITLATVNREISKNYMSEAEYAQIVFRSICSSDTIKGPIDTAYIRKLKAQNDTAVDRINALYANKGEKLKEIMQKVTENFCDIPKYVQVEIARESSTLYILSLLSRKSG